MLDKISRALSGSPSSIPTKGLLGRIDTLELKAAEEGHAARGIITAFETEGSIVKQEWTSPQRNITSVWGLDPDFQTEEDAEIVALRNELG